MTTKSVEFNKEEEATLLAIAREDFEVFFTIVGPVLDPSLRLFDLHREFVGGFEKWRTEDKLGAVLSVPPQHGKSTMAVLYVLWLASIQREQVGFITYSQELSMKHMEKVRDIVKSKEYRAIFPKISIKKSKDTKTEFGLSNGSSFLALGRDSGISGNPFTLLVLDDLVKNFQESISPTVQKAIETALATIIQRIKNNTRLISIGTRYYENDATGTFHKDAAENPEDWVRMEFPVIPQKDLVSVKTGKVWKKAGEALCPEITDLKRLKFIRSKLTDSEWFSAYQQAPLKIASFFKPEWFRYVSMPDLSGKKLRAFLTIDPAVTVKTTSDETGFCLALLDEDGFIYWKAWGEKLKGDELMNRIFDLFLVWNFEKVGIEKMMAAQAIQPFLDAEQRKRNVHIPIELLSHGQVAKEQRVIGALPAMYGNGTIYHIDNDCKQLEEQILNFPSTQFKDDVLDAATQMVEMLKKRRGYGEVQVTVPGQYDRYGNTSIEDRIEEGKKDYERWLTGVDEEPEVLVF